MKIYGSLHEPEMPEERPEGSCWRCFGKKEVQAFNGTMTPCGACLGRDKPPEPCPACDSEQVKLLIDGASVCWHCRVCGHRGPEFHFKCKDPDILDACNEHARKARGDK